MFEHGGCGHEPEVLVHEGNTSVSDSSRPKRQRMDLIVDADLARVGLVESGQDFDERGLAAPIGTEEAVDLSRKNGEIDPAQGGDTRERLLQPMDAEARGPGGRAGGAPTVVSSEVRAH